MRHAFSSLQLAQISVKQTHEIITLYIFKCGSMHLIRFIIQFMFQHRVLRECMWFMTSVEAHVQRMHAANMIGASTGTLLVRRARQTSRALKHLLNVFSVEGLPEQVKIMNVCVWL